MVVPVVLGLAAGIVTILGGLVAIKVEDRRHLVLGATGGVILGVIAFDLLPEAFEASSSLTFFGLPAVMILFVAGFLSLHVVEKSLALHQESGAHYGGHHHDLRSMGLLAGAALVAHSFLDGLGIGVSFAAGGGLVIAVTAAVLAHDFADGFNTFTLTSLYGNSRRRAVTLLVADAVAPLLGAVVGAAVSLPEQAIGMYLAYFAGFLLYIATSNILPEAHADHPSWATLATTLGGVVAIGIVMTVV